VGADAAGDLDDLALLAAWRAGDRELGAALFRRHAASIARFFRSKVPDSAEDLTQGTFLALVEGAAAVISTSFRAYLFGIARNHLLMYLRSRGRAAQRFDPLTWSAIDAGAGPAVVASSHQQHQLVMAALQRIPVDYQVALELHYFEDMALADIAAVLGQPLGTIKSQLSRGRALLRERLEELADPGELLTSAVTELDRWVRSLPDVVHAAREKET
jgi:RNA polymerase sigma factor (sigma-70 family)